MNTKNIWMNNRTAWPDALFAPILKDAYERMKCKGLTGKVYVTVNPARSLVVAGVCSGPLPAKLPSGYHPPHVSLTFPCARIVRWSLRGGGWATGGRHGERLAVMHVPFKLLSVFHDTARHEFAHVVQWRTRTWAGLCRAGKRHLVNTPGGGIIKRQQPHDSQPIEIDANRMQHETWGNFYPLLPEFRDILLTCLE